MRLLIIVTFDHIPSRETRSGICIKNRLDELNTVDRHYAICRADKVYAAERGYIATDIEVYVYTMCKVENKQRKRDSKERAPFTDNKHLF